MPEPHGTAAELVERHGLRPLPVEGGWFRETWAGPEDGTGRPSGTAIIALLTSGQDSFSALHRLPTDEVWHFYQGDPLELLLLAPDGADRVLLLGGEGPDAVPQAVIPAGAWMGARVAPGGAWSLFGTTMAPGFLPGDYEGADDSTAHELCARHPHRTSLIRALHRPGAPTRMTEGASGA
ncbi:cupin domain-containing protein [Streptomyces sp. NPDC002851]